MVINTMIRNALTPPATNISFFIFSSGILRANFCLSQTGECSELYTYEPDEEEGRAETVDKHSALLC